jgi:hypothetical protein
MRCSILFSIVFAAVAIIASHHQQECNSVVAQAETAHGMRLEFTQQNDATGAAAASISSTQPLRYSAAAPIQQSAHQSETGSAFASRLAQRALPASAHTAFGESRPFQQSETGQTAAPLRMPILRIAHQSAAAAQQATGTDDVAASSRLGMAHQSDTAAAIGFAAAPTIASIASISAQDATGSDASLRFAAAPSAAQQAATGSDDASIRLRFAQTPMM